MFNMGCRNNKLIHILSYQNFAFYAIRTSHPETKKAGSLCSNPAF